MSHLRFDGQGAGLGKREGGNANSLADYTLVCTCESELGPVAGFFPNQEGHRSVLCLKCKHVTVINKEGRVAAYIAAPKEILEKAARETVIKVNQR